MTRKIGLLRTPRFSAVAVGVCVALLGLGAWSSGSSHQKKQTSLEQLEASLEELRERLKVEDLQVNNKTRALEIVSIEKVVDRGDFRVTLRNGYDKKVTGFQVNVGTVRTGTELIMSGKDRYFISPGGTYTRVYATQVGLDKLGITVLCVVFEDGSSDGERKYIQEIKQWRLGMRMARERVLPLLRAAKNSSDPERLDKLEFQISELPTVQEDGLPDNVKAGLHAESKRILSEIDILKQAWPHRQQLQMNRDTEPTVDSRLIPGNLHDLIEYYENIVAKAKP